MSLLFDGVDDRVDATNVTGFPTAYPVSFACVIRLTGYANDQTILQAGRDSGASINYGWYILNTSGFARIYFGAPNTAADSTTAIPQTAWVFVGMASASASSHRLYCYNYETQTVAFNQTNTTTIGSMGTPSGPTARLGAYENGAATYSSFLDSELAWAAVYANDFTVASGDAFLAMAFLGPFALATPAIYFDLLESSGTAARERMAKQTWTLTNFPASPWRAVNLPGPWWTRSAHWVIRPQAVATAIDPGLLHYNAPGNQLTPHYPRAVPF